MDIVKHAEKDSTVSESLKSTLSTHVTDQDSAVMDGSVHIEEITDMPTSSSIIISGDKSGVDTTITLSNSSESIINAVNGEDTSKNYLLYTESEKSQLCSSDSIKFTVISQAEYENIQDEIPDTHINEELD